MYRHYYASSSKNHILLPQSIKYIILVNHQLLCIDSFIKVSDRFEHPYLPQSTNCQSNSQFILPNLAGWNWVIKILKRDNFEDLDELIIVQVAENPKKCEVERFMLTTKRWYKHFFKSGWEYNDCGVGTFGMLLFIYLFYTYCTFLYCNNIHFAILIKWLALSRSKYQQNFLIFLSRISIVFYIHSR